MSFRCTIVTPEAPILDETVTQAVIPAHDGQIGILTDRAPLLTKIGVGTLKLTLPGNKTRAFLVEGGVAQMKDNKLVVLSDNAIPAEEVTADRARAELAEAEKIEATDDVTRARRDKAMRRARAMVELAAG